MSSYFYKTSSTKNSLNLQKKIILYYFILLMYLGQQKYKSGGSEHEVTNEAMKDIASNSNYNKWLHWKLLK